MSSLKEPLVDQAVNLFPKESGAQIEPPKNIVKPCAIMLLVYTYKICHKHTSADNFVSQLVHLFLAMYSHVDHGDDIGRAKMQSTMADSCGSNDGPDELQS